MIKFRKPSGPAFRPGEVWVSTSGVRVKIVSVRCYGPDRWDWCVTYQSMYGDQLVSYDRDCWNF